MLLDILKCIEWKQLFWWKSRDIRLCLMQITVIYSFTPNVFIKGYIEGYNTQAKLNPVLLI